jgi:nitrite reductase/ring-hydroxylating ferredoxin subunit
MGTFVRVTGTTDVKPGRGIVTEMTGKTLAVFHVDGTCHAIDNPYFHRGGPLGEGDLEGSVVTYPWHGWQFDVATETCVANPSAKVEWYSVQVDGIDVKGRI